MSRKLVIIGAGSAYTPEIIDEIIRRNAVLKLNRIVMVDIESGLARAKIICSMARRMFAKAGVSCDVSLMTNRREALLDADFVISQIRVDGWQARAEDERIGLSLGLIGQETTGCGGFMNAMRTIPMALAIAHDVEEVCPKALLVNFTNPSGIVTEAIALHSGVRVVGLCNVPINMHRDASRALGIPEDTLRCRFAGLNHLSFMYEAKAEGRDVYHELISRLRMDHTVMKNIPKQEGCGRLIEAIGLIPSPYLQYYYFEPEMLEKELKELREDGKTRAGKVESINEQLFELFADEALDVMPALLSERGGSLYSRAAMDIIEAFLANEPREMAINIINGGAVTGLDDDACVEVSCMVSRNGVERLPAVTLPSHVSALINQVKAYEHLTVEAAVTRDRKLALRALLNHPLVHGFINAEKILDSMDRRETGRVMWEA